MGDSAPAKPILDTQLFRDAFNASPIGIAVENLDGQPLFVNPAFCRFLGFTEEELRRKHCVDFSPKEDAEKDWSLFQQLRAGSIDHYQLEKRYFRRDGSLVWGSLSISLLNRRPSSLVLAMVQDITEKKTAEDALFRHAAIVESSEDAIASGTLDGIIVSWNAGAQHMYGYTEAEAVGKPIAILVPPELADEENKILATLKMGGRIEQLETIRVTKTGKRINVSLSISPIKDSSGRIVGVSGIARDITERKRTEGALLESEERLRLAVQAGKMFAYSWDAATDVIERSGESAEILGVKSDQAATGAAISAMVHPDDKQRLEAALSNLNIENPTLQITYRIVRPDGEVKWLERNSRAYFDAEGKVKRIVGMIVDVTEHKRHEEKLREYERAIENAEEMIAVVDREYRYLIANREFLKLRNKTQEQVVGHFVNEVLKEGVFEAEVKPRLDECFQGSVVRYEMKYTYPELGERHVLVSYFPIEGANGIDRAACILQDITERKQAEESLRELNRTLEGQTALLQSREELLKIFVKNVPAPAAMLDRDMRYLQVSDRWCTDYLSGRAQVLGHSHYEIFPDMPERWKEVHRRALQGETLRADEDRWDGQDGTHWARWEVRPWTTAEGAVGGILILAEDITRRKQMEEALSDLSRKLIESQEQERTRIGRELHDDINQRLAMLSLELEQLQENPSEIQPRVKELRRQMAEVSNDVQALSHDLHSSKLEYLGVVAGMKSWCKEFAERQRIEIDLSSDVPSVLPLAVGLSLFRVLQEALNNAIKHSGVKRIEMQLREESGEIHLIVSDTGKGFDVEAALQGKGLGLTSMRERVRLVNGTITIDSKPMGGTTIHVRVPLESGQGAQREAV